MDIGNVLKVVVVEDSEAIVVKESLDSVFEAIVEIMRVLHMGVGFSSVECERFYEPADWLCGFILLF